jgi:signal transduction histidine kinase
MEGVRRVSDNIAHDLKTPLARMKNRVEELKFRVAGNVEEEAAVDQIIHEADGLLATFNALLRIARIEYSEQREDFKDVDMSSILYDLQELYEPLIEEKGQSLTVEISQQMLIQADRDMLFQAFANLLDNAIKYTPKQGHIVIRAFKDGGKWHIEISDDGPGIPENEYEKITQRFYRLDQSRTTPGSGLGLALVLAVLKLHDMQLNFADNKPGLKVLISFEQTRTKRREKSQELFENTVAA